MQLQKLWLTRLLWGLINTIGGLIKILLLVYTLVSTVDSVSKSWPENMKLGEVHGAWHYEAGWVNNSYVLEYTDAEPAGFAQQPHPPVY